MSLLNLMTEAKGAFWEGESCLRQILDNTTAVVYVKDREGRFLFVNRHFLRVFRLEEVEVIGRRGQEIFPPAIAAAHEYNDRRVLAADAAIEFEETAPLDDGEHTYISSKFPLCDREGQTCAVCGISTDITERKRTETALRKVALGISAVTGPDVFAEIIRHLAETLDADLVFFSTPKADCPGRLQTLAVWCDGRLMEPMEYELAGSPCEHVVGQAFRYIPTEVTRRFPGEALLIELGMDSYAGYPLFDTAGQAIGLLAVLRRGPLPNPEFTEAMLRIFSVRATTELERLAADEARHQAEAERARLEKQLRQAQKMEAIGQLTGGIAHDFNNILTSVMGYIVMGKDKAEQLGEAKLARYLERAHQSSQRARELIQQMLTFSRGQRGEPRPLALAPLIQEAVKWLSISLPSSIELHADLAPNLPPTLLDPVPMEQVIMNLCINARDAMAERGVIRIGLRLAEHHQALCASCRKTVSGHFIELAVGDTGPGIPPETLERMFEPFYSTKEVGKGSGMGLSVVHGIVHEYGGHVLVQSAPGQGALFRVLFPPLSSEATADSVGTASNATTEREPLRGRVLVVDDETAVGEFMQDLLEEWGLTVTVFSDSVEGRDSFMRNPQAFDLAVLDQTMPRLNGLDLARDLLRHRPELPVILYTGHREALSESQVQAAGVRALMRKPVEVAELHALLETLLPAVVSTA
jgi:PAS domain S-box-containing protein